MKALIIKSFILTLFLISKLSYGQNAKHTESVEKFYCALNKGDYNTIEKLISDDLKNYATNDFVISETKEKYKEVFQWDSIFSPKYKITSIEAKSDTVYVNTEKYCKRIAILYEKPLKTKLAFIFKDNLIIKKFEIEDNNTDWSFWMENKNKLLEFVKFNRPELLDFEEFQNKTYGERYLKVIDLYKKSN